MADTRPGSSLALTLLASFGLCGCGFTVPEMNVFSPDGPDSYGQYSTGGDFENNLAFHIRCSIAKGLWLIKDKNIVDARFLYQDNKWGSSVGLTLQVDEMSGVNPSLSTTNQYGNLIHTLPNKLSATYPQEFLFGAGANGAAHSTRIENITFTFSNAELLREEEDQREKQRRRHEEVTGMDCNGGMNGFQIQSNLKIDQFIWDQATLAESGTPTTLQGRNQNPYDVFQETLTFVVSLGGSVTPTWHIEQVVLNPTSPLFSAMRTETNTLVITLGPLQKGAVPLALQGAAQNQHQAASIGVATAGQNKASQ